MVTKENCKIVGAWSALMGMMVIVMSTVFFDQSLNLHKRYAPSEHLQTKETKKNYNWLIVIGMIGIFGGVAQCLISFLLYFGVQKKLTEYYRVYLFCIGEAISFMLFIICLAVALTCKAYFVTESLLNKKYETKQEINESQYKQVVNHIGGAFCLVLAIDIFAIAVSLVILGFKLKKREYENV